MLDVRNLRVTYSSASDAVTAIDGLSLSVRDGEFVCIVGPSGCGKTTLLKCLAGLLTPSTGDIEANGVRVEGAPPKGLALVFQDYNRSLLPWLSVRGNTAFPLRAQGHGKRASHARADEALAAVGLEGFEDKYPWQLSGGMQQRVAIARAVAYRPSLLLMDEPFASVDAQSRAELEDLVLRIHQETEVTMVLVTHDIDEAVYLSDRVLVLSHRPARIQRDIPNPLPLPRDQLATKATQQFVELRSAVLREIRGSGSAAAEEPAPSV